MSDKLDPVRDALTAAINDEEEFPGSMSDGAWEYIRASRGNAEQALRAAVRLTKRGILSKFDQRLEGQATIAGNDTDWRKEYIDLARDIAEYMDMPIGAMLAMRAEPIEDSIRGRLACPHIQALLAENRGEGDGID